MTSRLTNARHLAAALALCCAATGTGVAGAADEPLIRNARQLVFEGKRSGEGYFSADGRLMIFQSEREPDNPFYQMYLLDMESGDSVRVSPGVGKTTCGWIHPDGRRVLFASTHDDPRAKAKQEEELAKRAAGTAGRYEWSFDEHYDIFEADVEGRVLRNLAPGYGYDAEGSWSPDGRLIVFASNRHAYDAALSPEDQGRLAKDPSYFMDIYLMDADGANLRRLTTGQGYDGGPFFSPDGLRIVWRSFSADGTTAEIWTMRVDGTDRRQLTRSGVMSWAPFYHPSGEYVVYASNAQGMANFELYLVDVEGRPTAGASPGRASAPRIAAPRSSSRTGTTTRPGRSSRWRRRSPPRPRRAAASRRPRRRAHTSRGSVPRSIRPTCAGTWRCSPRPSSEAG